MLPGHAAASSTRTASNPYYSYLKLKKDNGSENSAFWARIRSETFLKVRLEPGPTYNLIDMVNFDKKLKNPNFLLLQTV